MTEDTALRLHTENTEPYPDDDEGPTEPRDPRPPTPQPGDRVRHTYRRDVGTVTSRAPVGGCWVRWGDGLVGLHADVLLTVEDISW